MLFILLITFPLVAGLTAFFIRNDILRRSLIISCSAIHLSLTIFTWFRRPAPFAFGWFALDDLGIVFLTITSLLFFGASIYAIRYLADENRFLNEAKAAAKMFAREAVFTGCFLLFLSTMTIVIVIQHPAVLWVGIEATTLASAPLLYFHRTKQSLEATWKYLLICSVGIAFALLGIFMLVVANTNNQSNFLFVKLIETANSMNKPWLKAAFLLFFVGYGTKMGLAPFHTWLPDAHSEAPSVISALLSGALLNCALLGILRGYQICNAAGLTVFCREVFTVFGLLSILFAAIFILGQAGYKRMLAYSSVEHMGIITLGIGLGKTAAFGAFVNMLGHSLTKVGLFLIAGNILSYFKTKKIAEVRGIINSKLRWSGIFWIIGFLLITGTPPSAIFLGKFLILREALEQGEVGIAIFYLLAVALVFIGMARIFISMTYGPATNNIDQGSLHKDVLPRLLPTALFFIFVIALGLYFPAWLTAALDGAVKALGGI